MSKVLNAGTLLGGLGGLAAGAIAVLQFVSPANIETPKDLIAALGKIEQAIQSKDFTTDEVTAKQLETAVEGFATQVALSTRDGNGDLLFVPRSFAGLREYKNGEVFDFVAPNGVSKLFKVVVSHTGIRFIADGKRASIASPGEHVTVSFGDMTCKYEVISFVTGKTATVRTTCAS